MNADTLSALAHITIIPRIPSHLRFYALEAEPAATPVTSTTDLSAQANTRCIGPGFTMCSPVPLPKAGSRVTCGPTRKQGSRNR
jgi:hypothetical protein